MKIIRVMLYISQFLEHSELFDALSMKKKKKGQTNKQKTLRQWLKEEILPPVKELHRGGEEGTLYG